MRKEVASAGCRCLNRSSTKTKTTTETCTRCTTAPTASRTPRDSAPHPRPSKHGFLAESFLHPRARSFSRECARADCVGNVCSSLGRSDAGSGLQRRRPCDYHITRWAPTRLHTTALQSYPSTKTLSWASERWLPGVKAFASPHAMLGAGRYCDSIEFVPSFAVLPFASHVSDCSVLIKS
eukprot:6213355-Pleurochrysis_carterae.AAC.1